MKLNNWSFVSTNQDDPYCPPEMIRFYLCGEVSGHPDFTDGDKVTTSPLIGKRNGKVVTKSGSEYELGYVDQAYEQLFPNAEQRLLAQLQEL